MQIVFDVHPAQARLHQAKLIQNLAGRVALARQVAAVEHQHQRRVVHLAMDFGQDGAVLAHQVGFQLDAVRQVAAQAGFGDLPQLIDHLRHVVLGVGSLGMIEREAADQLGLEGVRQLARRLDFLVQVFLEGDVFVLGAVVDVEQLDFADRRTDRGHVQAVFVFQVADVLDLALAQLHDVLDAFADVDEAQAVVLQSHGGKGGELLHGRFLIGRLVAKAAERDLIFLGGGHELLGAGIF